MDRASALRQRLQARYPLVYLLHADERDAVHILGEAAAATGMQLRVIAVDRQSLPEMAMDGLGTLLDAPEPTVLALPQGHLLLENPTIARFFLERLVELERRSHVLVLMAPVHVPCPELERERVIIQLALPSGDELAPLVAAALRDTQGLVDPTILAEATQAVTGLTTVQARRALRRVRTLGLQSHEAIGELLGEKRDLIAAGGVLQVVSAAPTLGEIGGLDVLKDWLHLRREALLPAAQAFGLPKPKGVLVIGVQGCGKSMIAKASSAVLGVPLLRLDLGRLYAGQRTPDENLRRALEIAEAMSPVVLWLDEIDKAFSDTRSETQGRVLGSLLTWLGEQRSGVFVAATANSVELLPSELLRKGRFDETFFVDLPDLQVRGEIAGICLLRSGRNPLEFDLEQLAQASDRLTGAEIEQSVVEALAQAWAAHRPLEQQDLLQAIQKTIPFVETYEPQVKALRQWARKRCRAAAPDRSLRELYLSATPPKP